MSQYNVYFKRIATALELTKQDVVEICKLASLDITNSRAEGWRRSENDQRRFVAMSEQQFDAFTNGLVGWSRRNLTVSEEKLDD